MDQNRLASRALIVGGVLLIVVAAIHLAVAPMLRSLFLKSAPAAARFWLAPFMLNHVVVGFLLIPVGLTTIHAGRAARRGAAWARVVALTNALSVLALPGSLVVLMGREYFAAIPFLIATVLVAIACLVMVVAAVALRVSPAGGLSGKAPGPPI